MISAPLRSDIFVGRGEELAFLRARSREAIGGGSCIVIVTGEAGIGKTRLLDELFRSLEGELLVVRVRCSPTVRDAAIVLHELCEAFSAFLDDEPPASLDAGTAFAYLRRGMRGVRSTGAIAIALEDAHHATPPALDALAQLAAAQRTILLLTADIGAAPVEVHEAFERLGRAHAYELRLTPLPSEAMRRMIRRFQPDGPSLSRTVITRVVEFAHGNPSVAQSLIRAATEDGDTGEVAVPRALRTRIRRTMAALDPHTQQLLLVAAALGTTFDLRSLAHVARERTSVVREALQAAALLGLVDELDSERFAFVNPLHRLALQSETTTTFALGYHRRAALYLQRSAADAIAYAAVAEQWRGARELDAAALWDQRAGDAAAERGDFIEAAAAYRRAQRDCREERTRRSLLFKRAEALGQAGMEREAIEALDEYLAQGLDDDRETWARALLQKCMFSWDAGTFDEVESMANEVLGLDLPHDHPLKARALLQLAFLHWTSGRLDGARGVLDLIAREHAVEDAETLGMFYQQRALIVLAEHGFDAAVPDFRRGIEHMQQARNALLYSQLLCNLGNMALLHAHNDLALEMLERACDVARNSASDARRHFALGSYARALMRVGRNEEAHAVLTELRRLDADLADINALYSVAAMVELGSIFDDAALLEQAFDSDTLAHAFESGDPKRILALVGPFALHRWHTGDAEAASALVHDALQVVTGATWHYPLAVLVAQFGPLTDLPRARRMLKPPLVQGDQRVIDAFVDLFEAFVARRRGRSRVAAAHGRRAATRFAAIGWPYYEAQAHEVAGDHADALRIYDRIGDARDAHKLRSALRPAQRSSRHAVALTVREREVGLLALDGLSNARIAERLGISERTVEHHLQVVYGKFGIRSRWQLPQNL